MTLTALQINSKNLKPGLHPDGNGLYLRVQVKGAKSWIYRFQLNGRRRKMGIGTLFERPLIEARAEAARLGAMVRSGVDPIEARKQEVAQRFESAAKAAAGAVTFSQVAKEYIAAHRAGWRNAKHGDQWANTLRDYAEPVIGSKPVADVSTEDVLHILQPIWSTKTETASRVRSRIELVLSYAKAKKMRQGENPAVWRGHLDALLPKPTKVKKVQHHPALPYARMPEFMKALREVDGFGARALELAILTAARSGEVRFATWSEFDLGEEARVWVVPANRMKGERVHRVPLSAAVVKLLENLPRFENVKYLFPGERDKKPLSDMTLTAVIQRMNEDGDKPEWIEPSTERAVVPHGFRSSFRDWAAEKTTFPHEMAEMALAHAVGDKVEAAYRRDDMFEKRREMMEDWSAWCAPKKSGKVVPIKKGRAI